MKHIAILCLLGFLFGCATTEETVVLKNQITSLSNELYQYKEENNTKLSAVLRGDEQIRKQVLSLYTSSDNREDKMKAILGKLDELEHQLQMYWNETKGEIAALKKAAAAPQPVAKQPEMSLEAVYKEAFEAFQKGMYDDALKRFSGYLEAYPETTLVPNVYYWMGECYMNLKNYEKAILSFQEVIVKYPKSEKAPRALLSQADAFSGVNDKKSSITILKRVIELFPKTEEAAIAERKLRGLNL
jgi:tol-pal system protein YbgF